MNLNTVKSLVLLFGVIISLHFAQDRTFALVDNLQNNGELPKTTIPVREGKLVIGLRTQIIYLERDDGGALGNATPVGDVISAHFINNDGVEVPPQKKDRSWTINGKPEFVRMVGDGHVILSSDNGQQIWALIPGNGTIDLKFAGSVIRFEVKVEVLSIRQGDSAESVIGKFGRPDRVDVLDRKRQIWHFQARPSLRVAIDTSKKESPIVKEIWSMYSP